MPSSNNTIRQALNKLVFEGLLVRKKGVGTTVADRSVSSKVTNWLSFTQEMEAKGLVPETFEIRVSWVPPIPDVSQLFGIPGDKEVLKNLYLSVNARLHSKYLHPTHRSTQNQGL